MSIKFDSSELEREAFKWACALFIYGLHSEERRKQVPASSLERVSGRSPVNRRNYLRQCKLEIALLLRLFGHEWADAMSKEIVPAPDLEHEACDPAELRLFTSRCASHAVELVAARPEFKGEPGGFLAARKRRTAGAIAEALRASQGQSEILKLANVSRATLYRYMRAPARQQ